MPQHHRKVPFSSKKKKDQILHKRQLKQLQKHLKPTNDQQEDGETADSTEITSRKLMEQPLSHASSMGGRNKNINRYNLQFYQESKQEIELQKSEGFQPLNAATPQQGEVDEKFFTDYDFPIRPQWSYGMSKEMLDRNEHRYFREYVDQLQKKHKTDSKELSLFELNLETWRQLWRVLEISDILLVIVDARYSSLMFPPALYKHIVETLKKYVILVLNKTDLVAPEVVVAWRHYFRMKYPKMPVVLFASKKVNAPKSRSGGKRAAIEGVYNIFRECKNIVGNDVDISSWEQKILEDMSTESICDKTESEVIESNACAEPIEQSHEMYRDGILTVGCVGFPNVGKSSLINALKGRKVVSVSRTPGHTKHFQTIFLTPVVRLCDCPGLVFPSCTPKYLQVLIGSFPISQLQVPYRSLKFLAEHLNLPELLNLKLPEDYEHWSAVAISDALALKRGFLTAKAARPDRYRAANYLLRTCLAGQQQIILQFYPPGFEEKKEDWLHSSEVDAIRKYQETETEHGSASDDNETVDSENEDSDASDTPATDETDEDEGANYVPPKLHNAFALLEDD